MDPEETHIGNGVDVEHPESAKEFPTGRTQWIEVEWNIMQLVETVLTLCQQSFTSCA